MGIHLNGQNNKFFVFNKKIGDKKVEAKDDSAKKEETNIQQKENSKPNEESISWLSLDYNLLNKMNNLNINKFKDVKTDETSSSGSLEETADAVEADETSSTGGAEETKNTVKTDETSSYGGAEDTENTVKDNETVSEPLITPKKPEEPLVDTTEISYDEKVQDFIDNTLDGMSFDSEEEFIRACGEYYVDLRVEVASEDDEYINYNVINSCAEGASAAVTVKKTAITKETENTVKADETSSSGGAEETEVSVVDEGVNVFEEETDESEDVKGITTETTEGTCVIYGETYKRDRIITKDADGNVLSYKEITYYQNGNVYRMSEEKFNNEGYLYSFLENDINGNLYETRESTHEHGEIIDNLRTIYRSDGTISCTVEKTFENGVLKTKQTNEYDQDGNIYESSVVDEFDKDGKSIHEVMTSFDKNGNVTGKSEWKHIYDRRVCITSESYDEEGHLKEKIEYNYNDVAKRIGKTVSLYDNEGHLTKTVESMIKRELEEYGNIIKEYDKEGKITSKCQYLTNGEYNTGEKIITEYNSLGNVSKSTYYDRNGNMGDERIYTYNEVGILLGSIRYDKDGSIVENYKIIYDENGNRTELVEYYNDDGEVSSIHEFQYDENGKKISSNIKWL